MKNSTGEQVAQNEELHRFELPIKGGAAAFTCYRIDDKGRYILTHTEVPEEFSGRGLASKLAFGIFEIARSRGCNLVLRCPFLRSWYDRHREFADLVEE